MFVEKMDGCTVVYLAGLYCWAFGLLPFKKFINNVTFNIFVYVAFSFLCVISFQK